MPKPGKKAVSPGGTQSIQRVALLLRTIADHNRLGLRVVDLCRLTDLERPTIHRMLQCLVAEDLVSCNPKTRNYQLGQATYELGLTASSGFRLNELCEPNLLTLAEESEETVYLLLRSRYDAICIHRIEGKNPIRSYTVIGTRRPLGIGAGSLAMLYPLKTDEIEDVIKVNGRRFTDYKLSVKDLRGALSLAKTSAYSSHDGPAGSRDIGVPIFDPSNIPFASIRISGSIQRMGRKRCQRLASLMRKEAAAITRTLDTNLHQPIIRTIVR